MNSSDVHPSHRTAAGSERAWGRGRSEGGYVMIVTLATMLVCLIGVTAVLSVVMSTNRIERTGRDRDRQVRAAESGLDVAINEIRNSSTMATGFQGELGGDCNPVTGVTDIGGTGVGGLIDVDGVMVRVNCINNGPTDDDGQGNKLQTLPSDDGGTAVRLVGGGYVGDANHGGDQARTWRTTFPFAGAMSSGFSQAELNNATGQLVHSGARPLEVVGSVELKHQIAAVTADGVPGPAIRVQGLVAQGGPGLFPDAGSGPPYGCGIEESDDAFGAERADVAVESVFIPSEINALCNEADLSAMGAGGLVGGSGDWNHARVGVREFRNWNGTVWTDLPANCELLAPPGGVISLEGSFNRRQTQILNGWFSNPDNLADFYPGGPATPCPGRTFVFEGGDIYFDVYDPALPVTDPRRHSLVFNNRESNVVFGTPLGWGSPGLPARPATTDFPEACDRSRPPSGSRGANIFLSPRTGLHHQSGRVAICGPILAGSLENGHGTAIYQRTSTSLGSRLLPTGMTSASFSPSGSAAPIQVAGDSSAVRVTQSMQTTCGGVPAWDSGSCQFTHQLNATGLGNGAPNPVWPGPGPAGAVFVDITGDAEFAAGPLSATRIGVVLNNGVTCVTTYPGIPDNNQTVSYELTNASSGSGTCATVLAGIDRGLLINATVTVRLTLNPPTQANTAWGWFNWVCNGLAGFGNWTGWWNLNCDNRPTTITATIDAVVLRAGWRPVADTPVSASNVCPGCVEFTNAANAATDNSVYATLTNVGQTFGRLRYRLSDPTLLDGTLPAETVSFTTRVQRPAGTASPADADRVDFVLSDWRQAANLGTNIGLRCVFSVNMTSMTSGINQTWNFTLGDDTAATASRCQRDGVATRSVDIGEFVSVPGPDGNDRPATMSVEVFMGNTGPSRTFGIDHLRFMATSRGYDRPEDPFTVTWNPLNPSADGEPRQTDALFNVFGSVSVPNNDVRVRWNWNASHSAGPTGFPIFNGPNVPFENCNPTRRELCRPALVAGALGSWTTGAWPAGGTAAQQPDPVASTGATRLPVRRLLLTACVVDDRGTPQLTDDRMVPRAQAEVRVFDVDGAAAAPGHEIRVDRWRLLQNTREMDFSSVANPTGAYTNKCEAPWE